MAFVQALRTGGIDASVAESLDAVRAVAVAGVDRDVLREALAAALVKDEADRPTFDALFATAFPLLGAPEPGSRKRRGVGAGSDGGASRAGGRGEGGGEGRARREPEERDPARGTMREREDGHAGERRTATVATDRQRGRTARARRLLTLPFEEMTSRDVAEARDLVRELGRRLRGRLARRERWARRGRLDFRRTLRMAVASGGVPVRLRFRGRRPGRPDLVALCDLSGSVAAASELLLGLIAPAADYFRRVHLFAYVDRLVPVSIEDGHVAPGAPLDLYARSDFGRVLTDLWAAREILGAGTLVLVLGDARNNRQPPRPELLRAVGDRVQRIVWLVPEPARRWNTGDSVLRLYAPACAAVLECLTLDALVCALRRVV